jgi:outer membrane biosynthesis protein TonB
MSDHGHHDPGGHELEAINTKLLFRLLFSLTLITFLSCIAVVQWFNSQRRELQQSNAAEGSVFLHAHEAKMAENLAGIDRVSGDILANPALLVAPPAPPGWIHPDDLVGGPAPKPAMPAEQPKPQPVEQPAPVPPAEPAPEEAPVPVELPKKDKKDDKKDDKKGDKPDDGE